MCGIAGIVNLDGAPVSGEALRSMCAAMFHRGPEQGGYYLGSGAGLGMRRLRIIDPESGSQPIPNEDGSAWVVFNGEIYNFRELRRSLEARGHRFTTRTDTEVIVHLYEEDGPRCVEKMRGMFAFAVWDEPRRTLLLARDRLGIKPLYYTYSGKRLVFASELKAILQLPEIAVHLNWDSLDHLFTFLSTPRGESIVRGVHKLEPGHVLVARAGSGARAERYWRLTFRPDPRRGEEECVEQLRELLLESVRLHMESDVPLGAFLSGGLDSSTVVASMARASGAPVRTFSIGFADADYSETEYARRVAARFGTEHQELVLEPAVVDELEDIAWYLDEPFGDSSAIPAYMVSRMASGQVRVALSGDGGDELFAGYDRYVVESRERRYRFLPSPLRGLLGAVGGALPEGVRGRNLLRHLSREGVRRYLDATTLFREDQKSRLFRPEVLEHMAGCDPWEDAARRIAEAGGDWLWSLQYLDLTTYLPLDILTKVDRMSMAHSLEARVPLLDHRLVEFAATLPSSWKLRDGTTKWILRKAMRGILPDEVIDRPKRGFAIPLGRWFRGELAGYARDLLLSGSCRRRGILNPGYLERILGWHRQGREMDLQIWTLVSFELWCRTFMDGRGRRARPEVPGEPMPIAAAPLSL